MENTQKSYANWPKYPCPSYPSKSIPTPLVRRERGWAVPCGCAAGGRAGTAVAVVRASSRTSTSGTGSSSRRSPAAVQSGSVWDPREEEAREHVGTLAFCGICLLSCSSASARPLGGAGSPPWHGMTCSHLSVLLAQLLASAVVFAIPKGSNEPEPISIEFLTSSEHTDRCSACIQTGIPLSLLQYIGEKKLL